MEKTPTTRLRLIEFERKRIKVRVRIDDLKIIDSLNILAPIRIFRMSRCFYPGYCETKGASLR